MSKRDSKPLGPTSTIKTHGDVAVGGFGSAAAELSSFRDDPARPEVRQEGTRAAPMGRGEGLLGDSGQPAVSLRADCPASAWAPSPAGHECAPPSAPPTTPCPTSANPAHIAIAFCRPPAGATRWGTLHMTRRQRASGQHSCAPRTEANGSSSRAPFSEGRKPPGGPPPRDVGAQLGLPLAGAGGLNVCQGDRGSGRGAPRIPHAAPAQHALGPAPLASSPQPTTIPQRGQARPGSRLLARQAPQPLPERGEHRAHGADGDVTDTGERGGHSGSGVSAHSPDSTCL